jgi:translation elongation factor EF-Ts
MFIGDACARAQERVQEREERTTREREKREGKKERVREKIMRGRMDMCACTYVHIDTYSNVRSCTFKTSL